MLIGNSRIGKQAEKVIYKSENITGVGQRGVLLATGFTQPIIDAFNPDVDEDTRKYSALKTTAKVLVGGLVGVSVRKCTLEFARYGVKKGFFKPIRDEIKNNSKNLDKFSRQIGTLLGVLAGVVTNFAIDMPLTKFLLKHLVEKYDLKGDNKEDKTDGSK